MTKKWPFADPENLAIFTLKRIVSGGSSILFVSHDEDDGGWQFLDGAEVVIKESALVCLHHIVELDPSLVELADLPIGWSANRSSPGVPWQRIAPEEVRDRKLISDVEDYGWHVAMIAEDDEGPGFAFSIGLYKNFEHPEIMILGLGIETMHGMINLIGEEVRQGRRFGVGESVLGIIEAFDVQFREVARDHYAEYLGSTSWFYKGKDYPVLQCVWPDKRNRFPWDHDFPDSLRARQPLLT
jgi:hypothetical protein